jgi:cell division protein FtsQ
MSARGAAGGKGRAGGIVQKPARRDRSARSSSAGGGTLRTVLAYLPLVGKILLAVVAGVLLFAGYRAAASASFFQARIVDVNPTTRASADEITRIVRRAAAQTGVWRIDLAAVSRELERVPWVRRAIVSRVLPDGLRVRVTERTPLAVVRTANGKFIWVDEDAVTLNAMSPTDRMPAFFIRGWDEAETDAARAANRERIQKYVELARDWEAAGLGERISEVDLADLQDVRVQLAGDDSQIEVRFLGQKNISSHLRLALDKLDAHRNTQCGPFITYLMVKPNSSVLIGTAPGMPLCGGGAASAPPASSETEAERAKNNARPIEPDKPAARNKETRNNAPRKDKEERAKKEQNKKEEARKKAEKNKDKGETRPRRVG